MQGAGHGDSGGGAGGAGTSYRTLRSRRTTNAMGEINVTPLVDVVLVLLLVFMITAPMMSKGIDVSLPVANLPKKDQEERVKVTLTADERLHLNGSPILLSMLSDQLHGMMEGRENKVVYLE